MSLRLEPCTYEAAKYAVTHWHYSHKMPAGKAVTIGVWEDSRFIGVVIFSRGANYRIGRALGLEQTEIAELTRVALTTHAASTSQIVSTSVRLLRKHSPALKCLVSYADPKQNHYGGIYQAMNWVYVGSSQPTSELIVQGKLMHKRSVMGMFGTASVSQIRARGVDVRRGPVEWKHTYYLPFDYETRERVERMKKPYPKRATSIADAPAIHAGEGGASPTVALHCSA